jgi:hypothetical protein
MAQYLQKSRNQDRSQTESINENAIGLPPPAVAKGKWYPVASRVIRTHSAYYVTAKDKTILRIRFVIDNAALIALNAYEPITDFRHSSSVGVGDNSGSGAKNVGGMAEENAAGEPQAQVVCQKQSEEPRVP